MKKLYCSLLLLIIGISLLKAQQIKINFANNLIDSSTNHYLIDTNNCGNAYTFCDDAAGWPLNAYQFDGQCGMQTDSFSFNNNAYNGFSVSFYMNKNFDSSSIQYGILHFYKGHFLIYAVHDSMFITITDSTNADHTYGVPCTIPNNEWFCTVISFTDNGNIDFYFNQVKYHAGTAAFKAIRRACEPGFCYPLHISTDIWNNEFFKGKLDDIRVWNWPSDSVNVSEICTKNIVPATLPHFALSEASLYPNPTNHYLTLEVDEAGQVILMDMTGRTVYQSPVAKGAQQIETSHLPQGNYLFLFKSKLGVYYKKVLVSH